MKKPGTAYRPAAARSVASARMAAYDILSRVTTTSAHSDDLLHSAQVDALSPEDRNLTTALVLGTLRWQLQLDAVLRPLLQRPDADLHPAAVLALRMGLFQLLHLDRVPAYAAINESVELVRGNGAPHAAGMVNAILRRVLREKAQDNVNGRATLAVSRTSAEQAHPDWLLSRWRKHFGAATARRITEYDQVEPPQHSLFTPDPTVPEIDDGSRLVAEIAAAAVSAPRRILDCCAAPGGKTAILAMRHPDAEIVAADISEKRLRAMRCRMDCSATTARVRTILTDMTKPQTDVMLTTPFDLILCDAPCSGSGTLARNPEIRHRLRESDLPRQAQRQRSILSTELCLLAPGGRLVYSTCSLEPEENEAVVNGILADTPSMRLVPVETIAAGVRALNDEARIRLASQPSQYLQMVPGNDPCDGFFAAIFER